MTTTLGLEEGVEWQLPVQVESIINPNTKLQPLSPILPFPHIQFLQMGLAMDMGLLDKWHNPNIQAMLLNKELISQLDLTIQEWVSLPIPWAEVVVVWDPICQLGHGRGQVNHLILLRVQLWVLDLLDPSALQHR